MPDRFDPYREALVLEEDTRWPEDLPPLTQDERVALARHLHGHADQAEHLDYIRLHTGFCRRITVTAEDFARWREGTPGGE